MKKTILIVEDNPELVTVYKLAISALGYSFIVATTGRQAVSAANAYLPDLIMLDIMLPEINGLEVARLIRNNPRTAAIPILAVTAASTLNPEEFHTSGCNDYLIKPFSVNELRLRIAEILH